VQSVTYNSTTQLTVVIDIGAAATTGYRNVTVTNTDATYGTGVDLFEVLATGGTPGPSITSVTPASVMQGSSGILISIQGQSFVSGCTVTFSNYGISIVSGPTYINDTEVRLTINVSLSAPTGVGTVTLTNPDTRYDAATFTVTGATPTVSLLDPNNATRSAQDVIVVITGSGFLSAAVVTTGGTYASTFSVDGYIYDSATQMRVQGDIGYWTAGGDRTLYIIVKNPNGAADSALFTAKKN